MRPRSIERRSRLSWSLLLFSIVDVALAQAPAPSPDATTPAVEPPGSSTQTPDAQTQDPPVAPPEQPAAPREQAVPAVAAPAAPVPTAAPTTLSAESSPAPDTPGPAREPAPEERFRLKGRLFALLEFSRFERRVFTSDGTLEDERIESLDLSLPSARVGLEYRSALDWLSAEVEVELADRVRLKDAYTQAGNRLFARAGQFKMPSAELELESPWTIPTARRGLVHDLLTEWLDVAGRRPGVALGYRGKGGLKPRIVAGVFQGSVLEQVSPGDRDTILIERAALDAQTYAARAEAQVWSTKFGVWFEQRVGSAAVNEFAHYSTLGADVTLDHELESGGLRAWLDVTAGETFYVHEDKPSTSGEAIFTAARVLLAYRFGGLARGEPYVEPFGFFALLDPDTEVVDDFALEGAVGLNAGYWDRARLTLQGELVSAERNLPAAYLAGQSADHASVLLQAGVRF